MPDSSRRLENLARAEFGDFTAAEIKLLRAAPQSLAAWCGPSKENDDPANDPSRANEKSGGWGPDRQIHAELIRWICVNRAARALVDPMGIAIHAAKITGDLLLDYSSVPFPITLLRCALTNDASFYSADVSELNFGGSWVRALVLDRATVTGSVLLRDGFHAEGTVQLQGTQIGGRLECTAGTFIAGSENGAALDANGITVRGSIYLHGGFRAQGEVRLLAAQIGGNLDCNRGTLINPPRNGGGGDAFSADLATVNGSVFLGDGFRAEGETRLVGTQIGGNLDCDDGVFINPANKLTGSGTALLADGMVVKGNVFFRNRCQAQGEVSLLDAQIGATLGCMGGTFINPSKGDIGTGRALSADRVTVKGDVFISDGFRADGRVRLPGAHIGGDLHCTGGEFKSVTLDLRGASVSSLWDDEKSWPKPGKLHVDGFVYGRIADGPTDARARLRWLSLQPEFTTQPYRQLAKVLRDNGDDSGAQQVLIAMEDRRWDSKEDHRWTDPFQRWPLKLSVGYGYDPLRAFWEVLALSALGWVIYRRSYLNGNIVPIDKDAYQAFKAEGVAPPSHGRFSALVYSVENSLPLVKLGQADKWQPDPDSHGMPTQKKPMSARPKRFWLSSQKSASPQFFRTRFAPFVRSLAERANRLLAKIGLQSDPDSTKAPSRLSQWGTSPKFLRWFLWVQILVGWLLATLFLAGVSGIARRE
jgi:hypothetical protein